MSSWRTGLKGICSRSKPDISWESPAGNRIYLPRNLIVICANLFDIEIPKDITVVIILMRHCTRQEEIFKRFKKLKIISNFNGELKITDKKM